MTFHVGQKVVCIRDTWISPSWMLIEHRPVLNGIYTIRDFEPNFIQDGTLAIRLVEITNPVKPWTDGPGGRADPMEAAFGVDRFRPLVETKTDISIFTAMLDPSRVKERA